MVGVTKTSAKFHVVSDAQNIIVRFHRGTDVCMMIHTAIDDDNDDMLLSSYIISKPSSHKQISPRSDMGVSSVARLQAQVS